MRFNLYILHFAAVRYELVYDPVGCPGDEAPCVNAIGGCDANPDGNSTTEPSYTCFNSASGSWRTRWIGPTKKKMWIVSGKQSC